MATDLQNKQNTNPPDGDYPFGVTRDKTPSEAGTRWDTAFMNDYIQFFHRMMEFAGLAYNNNPDNATNGFQMFEALLRITGNQQSIRLNFTHDGTSGPPTVVYSDGTYQPFGGITWTRTGAGIYKGTADVPGSFAGSNLQQVFFGPTASNLVWVNGSINDNEIQVFISRFDDAIPAFVLDDVGISNLPIMVCVSN